MGKYNKPKSVRRQEDFFKRFCPNCHKVTYCFKCSCGTSTRRLRMEQTVQSVYQQEKQGVRE